jgi:single-stranded-DNA-specific exonuclease
MNNQTIRWEIAKKGKIKDIAAVLLKNRGINTSKDKKEFFNPTLPDKISLKSLGINPKEVKQAIARIKIARKNKDKVIVYGDYDADGICGTAILWEALYSLGLDALPYIPERFTEGYGLNTESIKKLKSKEPKLSLIITVDHGIVADKKVDIAKELGIDVIITDHHQPGKIAPKSYATVHTTKIGGAAVAWILARELGKNSGLELAAIGTISDQLTLLGPNRSFAKYGLEKLNKTTRPGLLALFEEAAIKPGEIGPYGVGFLIAPRINATGRLTHAIDSLRLLCTKDKNRARILAEEIGRTNSQRQKIVEEVVLHARERLKGGVKGSVIILAHKSYHEGVIGLAAARLVDEFYKPAIVLSTKGKISKASARSIAGFNIIEAIRKLEGLYLEGGGHPMAAGFSISTVKIEKFSKGINKIAQEELTEEILSRRLKIDAEVHFNQLNQELFDKIRRFEPTGLGNPAPLLMTKGVNILHARPVGRDGDHLKLKLEESGIAFSAIAFYKVAYYTNLPPGSRVDIAFSLEENTFGGYKNLELKIRDMRRDEGN